MAANGLVGFDNLGGHDINRPAIGRRKAGEAFFATDLCRDIIDTVGNVETVEREIQDSCSHWFVARKRKAYPPDLVGAHAAHFTTEQLDPNMKLVRNPRFSNLDLFDLENVFCRH